MTYDYIKVIRYGAVTLAFLWTYNSYIWQFSN